MAKPEQHIERAGARPHGNRAHMRRKLSPMAYVELGQENGGILLNLSEGGFAVQSALTLSAREFTELRFQVPAFQGWLTANGRIVWMSDSKKEAGIQFTELPGEARREIHKWVAAEGDPEEARERVPVQSNGSREPSKQIFDTPYRGSGGAHEPAIAYIAQANAAEKEGVRTTQREAVGVAAAEPPVQAFRFTEYSMFAAEPEKEGVWAEPVRRRGNWGAAALLGILVAGLFFALGATVGRGTADRWIADLGGWAQGQVTPPPKVTPPAPPEQSGTTAASEDNEDAKSTADENQTKAKDAANANSGRPAYSEAAKVPSEEKKDAEAPTAKTEAAGGSATDGGSAASSTAPSAVAPGIHERNPRHSSENANPRKDREVGAEPSRIATGHSILVNAPGPGGRPFYVNLPGEAVSASPAIAISARRTLEILPSASGRSERVVIGKLISHSEPFYPVEARNQHIEGSVELRARVGRTGEIIGLTPISGPELLMSAAAMAVREWRYQPTFVDGDPAETLADITIVFRLP
jgi:outer membrane biosynthesis protein TonB